MAWYDRLLRAFSGKAEHVSGGPQAEPQGAPQKEPESQDIPARWLGSMLGPGAPIAPFESGSLRSDLAETEPRTFQYTPNINATIAPRIGYGLQPFFQLKYYAENVPEVAMCRRILVEELKNLVPQIVDEKGNVLQKAKTLTRRDPETGKLRKVFLGKNEGGIEGLEWMTTYPDGKNSWPVWLSRFLYNTIVYDAGCFFPRREGNQVTGMRVIDGSTIFCIVDERGELPDPPAPAFAQILYGQVRRWLTAQQLWYRPRTLRVDAPYGISPIEDCLRAVVLLDNLWDYESAFYVEGNMAEAYATPPEGWTPEKAMEWERAYNSRMSGNAAERRRLRVIPRGMTIVPGEKTAERGWKEATYSVALEKIALTFGIHPSEIGKAPGAGLGGTGFQEKGEDAHARLGVGPLAEYVESAFTDVLGWNNRAGLSLQLIAEGVEIDPGTKRAEALEWWRNNLITRDRALELVGEQKVGGEEGEAYYQDGAGEVPEEPPVAPANSPTAKPVGEKSEVEGEGEPGQITNLKFVGELEKFERSWGVAEARKHCGVCEEDDLWFGAPVSRVPPVEFPYKGANGAELVAMRVNNDMRPAVWKPQFGEANKMQELVGGPLWAREEAVYLIDRALGLQLVPLAYGYELEGEMGVVVQYVRGAQPPASPGAYLEAWLERAAALDFIAGQIYRSTYNWMSHPEDPARPILFDNGLALPSTPLNTLSVFVDAYEGRKFSEDLMGRLGELVDDVVWVDVLALVGLEACRGAQARLEQLLAAGAGLPGRLGRKGV